jgi:hypothetical protein
VKYILRLLLRCLEQPESAVYLFVCKFYATTPARRAALFTIAFKPVLGPYGLEWDINGNLSISLKPAVV